MDENMDMHNVENAYGYCFESLVWIKWLVTKSS